MKIFISYRFTGEDPKELQITIGGVENALRAAGHTTVCSLWEEERFRANHFSHRQMLEWALHELDACDVYLAFVNSTQKSEGMLIEAGYAIAREKRIFLAVRSGVTTTFLRHVADTCIEFSDYGALHEKLKNIK